MQSIQLIQRSNLIMYLNMLELITHKLQLKIKNKLLVIILSFIISQKLKITYQNTKDQKFIFFTKIKQYLQLDYTRKNIG
ncbi:unnamed protein product [Paramecium sonneborni]|uniref:Uncharacterized protein n=1 Tax=Paramecium sonneborni TaxID=65129 RepID=A0A8S1NA61_9CILI|nr:unnamed protein product [Paramecium sonneborni]